VFNGCCTRAPTRHPVEDENDERTEGDTGGNPEQAEITEERAETHSGVDRIRHGEDECGDRPDASTDNQEWPELGRAANLYTGRFHRACQHRLAGLSSLGMLLRVLRLRILLPRCFGCGGVTFWRCTHGTILSQASGKYSLRSAREPDALMSPESRASAHWRVPVAKAIHVSASISITFGGVPRV